MGVEGKQTQWPRFKCSLTLSVPFIVPPPPPDSALPALLCLPLLLLHRFCLLLICSTFLIPSFIISPFILHFYTSSFRLSVSSSVPRSHNLLNLISASPPEQPFRSFSLFLQQFVLFQSLLGHHAQLCISIQLTRASTHHPEDNRMCVLSILTNVTSQIWHLLDHLQKLLCAHEFYDSYRLTSFEVKKKQKTKRTSGNWNMEMSPWKTWF